MIRINGDTSSVTRTTSQPVPTSSDTGNIEKFERSPHESNTFSSLAQQLSAAATHALNRESRLTNDEVKAESHRLVLQLTDRNDQGHQTRSVDGMTATLSEQARRAVNFLAGKGSNPFQGLPNSSLTLIIWDDSQTFSLSERKAAWQEYKALQGAQQQTFVRAAQMELSVHGRIGDTTRQAQNHFRQLSAMAQAQYPEDYAQRLESIGSQKNLSDKLEHDKTDTGRLIEQMFTSDRSEPKTTEISATVVTSGKSANAQQKTGYQTLILRLYGNFEHPLIEPGQRRSEVNMRRGTYDFLTKEDRTLVADMYEYSQRQGVDLKFVDDLAYDLAEYRQLDNGRVLINQNHINKFDRDGYRISFSHNKENALTIKNILNSTHFKSTRLDKGFLKFAFDPGFQPYSNGSDLQFMAQMINHFSAQGTEHDQLDRRFEKYDRDTRIKDKIVHRSSTVQRQPLPEPDYAHNNGVWTITPKGKAAGYVMDPLTGTPMLAKPSANAESKPGHVLDGFFDTASNKRSLLTPFNLWFMKYKLQGRVRRP
ncbi:hypothetical protein [Pseudomonas sp. StFLB209]|uniref:hypothetical protein n=1 Tax=Pseudomonas sp. StFLB209 TaxID=1028989 RepID=UPI000A586B7B|nr:hypothetical protein [Pseudomonas sp. StFLB209]